MSAVTFIAVGVLAAPHSQADTLRKPKTHLAAARIPAPVYNAPTEPPTTTSADVCGSMLMPAAALKQVSRGFSSFHSGVDLMAPYGSPIRAAAPGKVIFAGVYFGYGNMVDIQRDDGVVTRYAHLSAFGHDTKIGHVYTIGDVIGQIGTSGHAHGAHVHFEVRIAGHAVDPKPYLALSNCPIGVGPAIEEARAAEAGPRPTAGEGRPGGLFQ